MNLPWPQDSLTCSFLRDFLCCSKLQNVCDPVKCANVIWSSQNCTRWHMCAASLCSGNIICSARSLQLLQIIPFETLLTPGSAGEENR